MEHLDVVVVGAGIAGISSAWHLQDRCPGKTYAVLEARDDLGGTWDLFRYPGVRSDSDMQTLGFRFRPWTGAKSLADGPSILGYLRATTAEAGIDARIRFRTRVTRVAWSTPEARWTVHYERDGEPGALTCSVLHVCAGYYRYDEGYTPPLPGLADFGGTVVHPQFWPADLDWTGRRVVVIGSGATAVTLVPALAGSGAGHVTMLQRSPSYVVSLPAEDAVGNRLRRLLGDRRGYAVTRWKNVARQTFFFRLARRFPRFVRGLIRAGTRKELPEGYAVDTHFRPRYDPWDERLCLVPDGDLFAAIAAGRAEIVTDTIDTFTPGGIRLASGAELQADVVVTATGLNMQLMGGVAFTVDGEDVAFPEHMAYKGMMLSGLPNFVFTIGYTNASWTLKADLVSEFLCRLINHMDAHGYTVATPEVTDPTVTERPLMADFQPGYVRRSLHLFPKQGSRAPWEMPMNYPLDVLRIRHGAVDAEGLTFARG